MKSETTIFGTPPQEVDDDFAEEVNTDKEYTEFDFKNLGRKVLCAEAEAY